MNGKFDRYLSSHLAGLGGAHTTTNRLASLRANYAEFVPTDKSAAVLDIGPGRGELLHYLVRERELQNVEAIDLSAEVAEYCGQRFCPTQHVEDPMVFLRDHPQKYDLIMLLHVLEHVEKPQAAAFLQAIRGALKPSGSLIIEVPNMGNPLVGLTGRYADFTHETGFTGSSLAQVLRLAGFDEVIVRPFRIPTGSPARIVQFTLRALLESFLRLLTRLYTVDVEINSANLVAIAARGSDGHG
jgi:2-polyprenyl-3-methyl-5-hydroxy-6-metoxy-1,4-benzoquinol methylase